MTQKPDFKNESKRSDRWIDGLRVLARGRGDADAVWQRAVELTRQLNIAPWIALAVAEGIIPLKAAPLLDRASRCEALRGAVLDKRKTMDELRTTLPYAAHLLAVELVEFLGKTDWELRKVTTVAEGLLNQEKRLDEGGRTSLPVRTRSLEEYAAAVARVRHLIERTGCNMRMALDVEAGRLTEAYVVQYVQQRRRLVREELRDEGPPPSRSRPGFSGPAGAGNGFRPPVRSAGGSFAGRRFPPRRPEMGDARTPRS
jgi:hypothetical protein